MTNGQSPPKRAQRLEFIPVSGKNPRGDASTRRRVRSHAQADYRRRVAPPPRPALLVDLDVTPLLNQTTAAAPPALPPFDGATSDSSCSDTSSTSSQFGPLTQREASSDRFGLLPENQQRRARLLWDHLYDGTCVVFKSMVAVGFIDLIGGSSALTQMLSSSAFHMEPGSMSDKESNADYVNYSVMATRSLRQELSNPRMRARNEVVVAILAFAAFANLISNSQLINIHLDGLATALAPRGGLESVDSVPVIRLMIYWIDISGGYLQDLPPRYSQPSKLLAMYSRVVIPCSEIDRLPPTENLLQDPAVQRILNGIQQVNKLLEREYATRGDRLWTTVVLFPGLNVSPVLHDLLCLPRSVASDDAPTRRREALRLAAILYLTDIRAKFGIDHSPGTLYATKLRTLMKTADMLRRWGKSSALLGWVLLAANCCSCVPGSIRLEFADMLRACLRSDCLGDFNNLEALVSGSLWSNIILGPGWSMLREQLLLGE